MNQPSATGPEAKPQLFELRVALIFAATIAANGFHLPYFPLWLDSVGFAAPTIAVILSAPMFLRVITTPILSSYTDRSSDRATLLLAFVGASVLVSLGYFLTPTYGLVLGVSMALAVVWSVQNGIIDSIALSGVRRFGADYSRMRIWGSVSYLCANLAGGVILARTSAGIVPVLFTVSMSVAFVFCLFAPRLGAPRARMAAGAASTPLYRQPSFLLFMVAAGLIQSSHAFLYGFSSIVWKSMGIGDAVIGALWAFAVIVEVIVFALFRRAFDWMSPLGILYAAAVASILRWLLFPAVWPAGLGVAGFFAVQSMHGISTGLMIIGVQKMIGLTVAEHQTGSAQGISYFTTNFGMAVATLGSGWLYDRWSTGGFYVMAAIAAAGLLTVAAARRAAQPQTLASGGYTTAPS